MCLIIPFIQKDCFSLSHRLQYILLYVLLRRKYCCQLNCECYQLYIKKTNLSLAILKWENLLEQNLKEITHRLNNWNMISFGVYPSNLFPEHKVYIFLFIKLQSYYIVFFCMYLRPFCIHLLLWHVPCSCNYIWLILKILS